MAHYIAAGVLAVLLALMLIALKKTTSETLYQTRNIGLIAVSTAALLLIVSLLADRLLYAADYGWKQVIDCLVYFPTNFAHFSIFAIAMLGLAMFVSNIELMRHEGMRPSNLLGTFIPVFQIALTVVLYFIALWISKKAPSVHDLTLRFIMKFIPMFGYCLLDYMECVIFGTMVMGYAASRQKPKHDKDFIIILGCSISKTGGLLPLIRGRADSAIHYAWEQEMENGKPVSYVPSGGQGSDEIMSEGSAMELYLLAHSAEEYEVFAEKESRNTYENFRNSFAIIDSLQPGAKAAFATTNYHVLRSGMIVHRMGREVEGVSSRTKWYFWPNGFAREVVAICVMTKTYHILAVGVMAALCLLLLALQLVV